MNGSLVYPQHGFWLRNKNNDYSKCSKISNTFLILISNKMLIFRAGMDKLLVRIANRGDPDQTACYFDKHFVNSTVLAQA